MKAIIVIGGGPAGLTAAGFAAQNKENKVVLLEKKQKTALKLGITGKGRCNLTNESSLQNHLDNFGKNGKWLQNAYARFFVNDLLDFLKSIGVETITEQGKRVYPVSKSAVLVARKLTDWAKQQGVNIITDEKAEKLLVKDNKIFGVKTIKNIFYCDKLIIATGGKSYPLTGSTGDGYDLLKDNGHKITKLYPVLSPLKILEDLPKPLPDLKLKNIRLNCLVNGKKKHELFGEMFFNKDFLDGALIITLSRLIVNEIKNKKKIELHLDLKPALDHQTLDKRLIKEFEANKKDLRNILKNILPWQMIDYMLNKLEIDQELKGFEIDKNIRKKIKNFIKEDLKFTVFDSVGYTKAVVTKGGVSLKEVDPVSMESKIVKNLYICGELLDLDANTGGYNLQAAFSTGYLAGSSV